MGKNAIELQTQGEIDRDILSYVREMMRAAPVEAQSVFAYLAVTRRRKVILSEVEDRLNYLTDAGFLILKVEWEGGRELRHWLCTALGMDVLDGNVPPRNWKARG